MKSKGQFIMLFMCGACGYAKCEFIAHNWQQDAFISDAIELNNFEIDTARYQLNNESQAFGVGTNFAPLSNNVSFSEQKINLYEQQIEKVENHQLLNLIN